MMYPEDEKRALDLLGYLPSKHPINLDRALIDSSRDFIEKVFGRRTTPVCAPRVPRRDQVRIAVHNALRNKGKKLPVQSYLSGEGMAFNPVTRSFFYPHGVLPKKVIIGRTEGKTKAADIINYLEAMGKVVSPRQTGKGTLVNRMLHDAAYELSKLHAREERFMDFYRQTVIKDMYGR